MRFKERNNMPTNDKTYAKEYNKQYYKKNKNKWEKKRDDRSNYRKTHRESYNASQLKYAKKTNYKYSDAARSRKSLLINNIKTHYGCLNPDCKWGDKFKSCCLDFHHLDNDDKTYVSQMLNSSYAKICKEINKCTVLCAICHRLATYDELNCSNFNRCSVSQDLIIDDSSIA